MPEITEYAPGTPSWIDLGSPDIEGSKAFYTALFGWEAADQGPDAGGYQMFMLQGKPVAGLGPAQNPGPPYWTTYVTVADADATAGAVRDAGGTALLEPMDVLDAGRMAVFADPTGVPFSIWQAGAHIGSALVNEVGSLCWNELNSRDTATAAAFYGAVFGWEAKASDVPGMDYTELLLDGKSIAGMIDMNGRVPEEIPPHWLVYLGVADVDATVAQATELGGTVFVPPTEIPTMGRFAVIGDPQGAFFGTFEFGPPS
jgi:hypothetical protein